MFVTTTFSIQRHRAILSSIHYYVNIYSCVFPFWWVTLNDWTVSSVTPRNFARSNDVKLLWYCEQRFMSKCNDGLEGTWPVRLNQRVSQQHPKESSARGWSSSQHCYRLFGRCWPTRVKPSLLCRHGNAWHSMSRSRPARVGPTDNANSLTEEVKTNKTKINGLRKKKKSTVFEKYREDL
jgi:hypothetical protein